MHDSGEIRFTVVSVHSKLVSSLLARAPGRHAHVNHVSQRRLLVYIMLTQQTYMPLHGINRNRSRPWLMEQTNGSSGTAGSSTLTLE